MHATVPEPQPLVFVIILNYGTAEDAVACYQTVMESAYSRVHTLVIDNGSPDESAQVLAANIPAGSFLALESNRGYVGGNNRGIEIARDRGADYYFIVNPDIRLPPNAIEQYVNVMQANPDALALNPVQLASDGRSLDPSFCQYVLSDFPEQAVQDLLRRESSVCVNTLFGAALMLTPEAIRNVGMFDPLFFAYGEEEDLCRRIRRYGGKLVVTGAAPVRHLRHYSGGAEDRTRAFLRSRGRYLLNMKDLSSSFPAVVARATRELSSEFLRSLWRRRFDELAVIAGVAGSIALRIVQIHTSRQRDRRVPPRISSLERLHDRHPCPGMGQHQCVTAGSAKSGSPRFSVVIPTYERRDLVCRAIESVLGQSYLPQEIIVVDDGSTDGTREVMKRYPSVRYVRQENAGASAARNHGVQIAINDWIAFLDSDDQWYPRHLRMIADAILATNGGAALYFTNTTRTADEGHRDLWAISQFDTDETVQVSNHARGWVIRQRQPMMLQSSVVRKHAYLELGGLWEQLRICHDTHFFIRIGIEYPICAVAGCGCLMTADDQDNRLAAIGASNRNFRCLTQETCALHQDVLSRYPKLERRHRAQLRRHVADAKLCLFRIAYNEADYPAAAKRITEALWAHPLYVVQGVWSVLWRRIQSLRIRR